MIVEVIILLLAFPTGYLISWYARDELNVGRVWFQRLFIICICASLLLLGLGMVVELYTTIFIGIVALVSYTKSSDKKWLKTPIR